MDYLSLNKNLIKKHSKLYTIVHEQVETDLFNNITYTLNYSSSDKSQFNPDTIKIEYRKEDNKFYLISCSDVIFKINSKINSIITINYKNDSTVVGFTSIDELIDEIISHKTMISKAII